MSHPALTAWTAEVTPGPAEAEAEEIGQVSYLFCLSFLIYKWNDNSTFPKRVLEDLKSRHTAFSVSNTGVSELQPASLLMWPMSEEWLLHVLIIGKNQKRIFCGT